MSDFKNTRKAVVVGGGPVGCLSALSLAKMGWVVELYEGRAGKQFLGV
jgi:kynurenine 3-monooxygenase